MKKLNLKFVNYEIPIQEQIIFCLLLTLIGGFFDSYTYVNSNGIFANAQTGNIIFIGINLANGEWKKTLHYFYSICAFIFGVICNEYITEKFSKLSIFRYLYLTILIQLSLLILIFFVPYIHNFDIRPLAISCVCAMQFDSFRKINNIPFASVFCTGNLRSGSEYFFKYVFLKNKTAKDRFVLYVIIILTFLIGVVLGGLSSKYYQHYAILIPIIILIINLIFLKLQRKKYRL